MRFRPQQILNGSGKTFPITSSTHTHTFIFGLEEGANRRCGWHLSIGFQPEYEMMFKLFVFMVKCVNEMCKTRPPSSCTTMFWITASSFFFLSSLGKESLALARNVKHLNCPTVKKQKQRHNDFVAAAAVFFFSPFQIHALIYPCFIANDFWIRWRTKRGTMKRIRPAAGWCAATSIAVEATPTQAPVFKMHENIKL